jgi:inorganic triphosphatase YgiF
VLTNAFQLGNYRILHTQRVPILDEYLDTNDLLLHRTKRTFRVRRRNNKLTVTTKTLKGFAAGEFHREEKTWEIDQPTYDEQLTTGFGRFRDHVKDIGQRPMSIRLKVTNERDLYIMRG